MDQKAPAPSSSFWLLYWKLLQPFRRNLMSVIRWIVAMQALALIEPWIMTTIVDDIVKNGQAAKSRLLPMAAGALIVLILIGFVKQAKDQRIMKLGADIYADVQIACAAKLLKLPLDYHLRSNTGEIIGKVTNGTGKIVDMNFFLVFEIIPLFVQTILSTSLLLYLHPVAPLALVPPVALFAWLTHRFKRKAEPSRRTRHEADRRADSILGQAVTNVMTVQAFTQEDRELGAFVHERETNRSVFLREMDTLRKTEILRNSAISIGRIALIVICAQAVFGNYVTIGKMILMVTLAEKIFINCYRLGGVYDRVMDCQEPAQQINALLEEPECLTDPDCPAEAPPVSGRIELTDASFSYGNAQRNGGDVLRNISLYVNPGNMLGIVGQSGAGKSTFAKLLLSFYRPTAGQVLIDGVDMRKLRLKDIRSRIGYVPQEVELFDDTIRANIAYGKPKATEQEVIAAAKAANAHEFIMQCGGYGTVIGNRGLKLSGGQRQRVGIARALLLQPSILILDEATSSVDPETIWEIKQALQRLRGNCSLIVISHQLATLQDADWIVLIKDGKVDGAGKHGELLRRSATYLSLVQRQQALDMASRTTDPSSLS